MRKNVFKVQDTETGKYWNGNSLYPAFNDNGARWISYLGLERELGHCLAKIHRKDPNATIPKTWQVIAVQNIEEIKYVKPIDEVINAIHLKVELQQLGWRFSSFFDEMTLRGVINDIQFIFELKPEANSRFISLETVKEARAKLRQIGIKTRTFREHAGMFGMLNREQALKARLALEIKSVVDLAEMRQTIAEKLHKSNPSDEIL